LLNWQLPAEKIVNRVDEEDRSRLSRWLTAMLAGVLVYLLSSGPVLATAFWLRERTGWDGFYYTMWVYFPLLFFGPSSPFAVYVEWWTNLFGTVGPG
jgi:hypothetical protein